MARQAKKPEARSPYQKYGKSEIRYSAAYYAWRNAAKAGRPETGRLALEHSRQFGMAPTRRHVDLAEAA